MLSLRSIFPVINWYLVLYIILSVIFVFYGTTSIYSTGQIRGVIFGIGTSLVLIYYGLRWFGTPKVEVKNWPPVINMCPDFLTFVPNIKSGQTTTPGCVDLLGVSASTNSAIFIIRWMQLIAETGRAHKTAQKIRCGLSRLARVRNVL